MTQSPSLFRSFLDMDGIASRKRGWLVFGLYRSVMAGLRVLAGLRPDALRWVFALRAFFGVYWIPRGSMKPTLLVGDYLLVPPCEPPQPAPGGDCRKSMARATLPDGRSHAVLSIGTEGFADNSDLFTVPAGQLFFLGDNRDNAMDSRFGKNRGGIGFAPFDNVIGRVSRIVFSSAGTSLGDINTWRSGRYWSVVE